MHYIPAYSVSLVRDSSVKMDERPSCTQPIEVAKLLRAVIPDDGSEHLGILLLDVRGKVIGQVEVAHGGLSQCSVSPREIFRPAIAHNAHSILLYHNHPSGDPTPSPDDIQLTHRIRSAGDILGIKVHDHIIIANGLNDFYSLCEHGRMLENF
jgi:DNA repair protein RadC